MAGKIQFGLSNVHIAKRVDSTSNITYEEPKPLMGAVKLSLDPQGESEPFYADNMKYYNSITNNGYEGELEIADAPKWFLTDYLGYKEDSKKNLVEMDKMGGSFALLFQVETDEHSRKMVLFNCVCSRSKIEHQTREDKTTPTTVTLSITSVGEKTDKGMVYKAVAEKDATNYSDFFTACAIPTFTE